MISLDLTKLSKVRKTDDQSKYYLLFLHAIPFRMKVVYYVSWNFHFQNAMCANREYYVVLFNTAVLV